MKIAIKFDSGFKVIEAEPATICGLEFALHRTPGKTVWSCTHIRTGYALVSKQRTKELARSEAALRINCHGLEKVQEFIARYPSAPPVEGLPEYTEKPKADKVDAVSVVDLIAKAVGGLTDRERCAVSRALNSRTGQLKAKSPSAFGDADEKLACAAWQGIQPNGYKLGILSAFVALREEECKALYDKLNKVKWPAAFDKDKLALVNVGVW